MGNSIPWDESRLEQIARERAKNAPKIGDCVRWGKPGPVIVHVERVGVYVYPQDAWNVVAGGVPILVRADGEDGIPWVRFSSPEDR